MKETSISPRLLILIVLLLPIALRLLLEELLLRHATCAGGIAFADSSTAAVCTRKNHEQQPSESRASFGLPSRVGRCRAISWLVFREIPRPIDVLSGSAPCARLNAGRPSRVQHRHQPAEPRGASVASTSTLIYGRLTQTPISQHQACACTEKAS